MNDPDRSSLHSRRWWILAVMTVVVAAAAAVVVTQLPANTVAPGTTTVQPTAVVTTTAQSASATTTAAAARYQLLWPFADEQEAAAWQVGYRKDGHQPWHLDAGLTAQSFTRGYLGYGTLDRVTTTSVIDADAHVGVGYELPDGRTATAAVIHLVKISTGRDAPWEAVGTDDTPQLTLTTPPYGSTVTSPAKVGGNITGVDESLRIQVFRLAEEKPIGRTDGIPAGGQNTPWTAQVSFTAPTGSVLTIAVSTGGHVNDVERFAVTGVRSGPAVNG